MTPQEAEDLLARYAAQQCTQDEENLVNSWLNKVLEERKFPENFSMNISSKSEDWKKLIAEKERRMPEHTYKIRRFRPAIAAAVAAVAIGIFALVYYQPSTKVNDVSIAANKDTTITQQKMNLKTVLPDGSMVYLYGASRITFTKDFKGKERKVVLVGAGFFEISPDKNRPFIVTNNEQQVRVLGTHFYVSNYKGEAAVTSVVQGAVKVTDLRNKNQEITLRPGEQAILNKKGFERQKVDTNKVKARITQFFFDDTPMKIALKEIGRWHNVEVDSRRIENLSLVNAVYQKNMSLPSMLREISKSAKVNLVLRNNVITVE